MADAFKPLPADVDVSDMPHIPLFDTRLMKSKAWRRAKNWRGEGPGLGFALFNLWASAFRALPGGSLEDDEGELADAAGCSIEHWRAMKDDALIGWHLAGGRWHHEVVSEIVWGLWVARLNARHSKACDSWRAACKRADDKGRERPESPGPFGEWLAASYPASSLYMEMSERQAASHTDASPDYGNSSPDVRRMSPGHPDDKGKNPSDFGPKQREGKDIPPIAPPLAKPVGGPAQGAGNEEGEGGAKRQGNAWWRAEVNRLEVEFGEHARLLKAETQERGKAPGVGFVKLFKGCRFRAGNGHGPPAVICQSHQAENRVRRRADIVAAILGSDCEIVNGRARGGG